MVSLGFFFSSDLFDFTTMNLKFGVPFSFLRLTPSNNLEPTFCLRPLSSSRG
jgi:hypothetical protein